MKLQDIQAVYFIGAGGIGMSALVRYFHHKGLVVAGYDKTPTDLTRRLEKEGIQLHYEDNINLIPDVCKNPSTTLVVYTPAIPNTHRELIYFRENHFEIEKRAQVLGRLTQTHKGLCFAGTHGKTSTSTMCAHIMHESRLDCNAFLGGISKNYGTNYIFSPKSDYVVIEADEFDRSFHWLRPYMSVITSTDPDHLDIYGTKEAYLESFRHYTELIQPGGTLVIHKSLEMKQNVQAGVKVYEYSRETGDFHAENVRIMSLAQLCGCTADELRNGMKTYAGVDRRFDFKVKNNRHVLLSDYAHHPKEIIQSAKSLKEIYPDRKITVIFQPHLYSRTHDFYMDFAEALSHFDEVILTEIYPAREKPMPGVTSALIYDNLKSNVEKQMIKKDDVLQFAKSRDFDVLVVLGAGNLDNYTEKLAEIIKEKE